MYSFGVMSARNASVIASNPKDANPNTIHGAIKILFGTKVRANRDIASTQTKMAIIIFLPKISDNLPHKGPLNNPAIFNVEKMKVASI